MTALIPLALISLAGCTPEAESASEPPIALSAVEFQRPARSGEPNLTVTPDGEALLTWLEPVAGETWALRFATRTDGTWSEPRTIRESDEFFVNWADFPSSVEMTGGEIAVHWLEWVADAPYAYHVLLSISTDGGETWGEPFRAHDDASPTEHGFVSMVPWEDGAALTWLDGRAVNERGDPMSLRFRTLLPDGKLGAEVLLDGRTCECCQTTLARTGDGLIASYRNRSETEIRDIGIVRGFGENWSEPALVAVDDWMIPGCPVNGPQLSASGSEVVNAWYTGSGGKPKAFVAFSTDAGETFGTPIRIDEGLPIGRVDVELLGDGSAVVTWLEASGGSALVMARRVTQGGVAGSAITVTETSGERASGFPRLVRLGDELLFAWTLPGDEGGIRVRSASPSASLDD